LGLDLVNTEDRGQQSCGFLPEIPAESRGNRVISAMEKPVSMVQTHSAQFCQCWKTVPQMNMTDILDIVHCLKIFQTQKFGNLIRFHHWIVR